MHCTCFFHSIDFPVDGGDFRLVFFGFVFQLELCGPYASFHRGRHVGDAAFHHHIHGIQGIGKHLLASNDASDNKQEK